MTKPLTHAGAVFAASSLLSFLAWLAFSEGFHHFASSVMGNIVKFAKLLGA